MTNAEPNIPVSADKSDNPRQHTWSNPSLSCTGVHDSRLNSSVYYIFKDRIVAPSICIRKHQTKATELTQITKEHKMNTNYIQLIRKNETHLKLYSLAH